MKAACSHVVFEVDNALNDVVDLETRWMTMIRWSWQEMEDGEDPLQQLCVLSS